jgi:cytochrome d ubiquinol oxidase subunit II
LREWAYRRIPWLTAAVFVVLGLAFAVSLTVDAGAVAQGHLKDRPWGWIFAALAIASLIGVVMGARARRDGVAYTLTVVFIAASYLTLGTMFWPYMVPYAVTVGSAAAPEESLRFLFYGGVVVLPVIAIYTIGVYWVFRGKVRSGYR